MGYFAEVNPLLRLPKNNLDPTKLEIGETYFTEKENERIFPLHCAILLEGADGIFYGYCTAESITIKNKKSIIEFKVLSLFSPEERQIYTKRFIEAAKLTGEIS